MISVMEMSRPSRGSICSVEFVSELTVMSGVNVMLLLALEEAAEVHLFLREFQKLPGGKTFGFGKCDEGVRESVTALD